MPADQPLVVISKSGSKRWISAADTAARKLGLKVGMPASKAQAVVTNLTLSMQTQAPTPLPWNDWRFGRSASTARS